MASRWLGALVLGSSLALSLADLAGPLLGPGHPATLLSRAALAPTCHQLEARSLALAGIPLSSCARCTGVHVSGLAGGALVLLLPLAAAARLPRPRTLVLLGLAPLGVEACLGLCWGSWDHPVLRAATGFFAGVMLLLSLRATPN